MSRKPEVAELERYLNAAQKANCDLEERAETAEAELKEWQVLRAWGGTPEIVEQWIKGQQVRIHHAQDIEESLAKAEARVAELEQQMQHHLSVAQFRIEELEDHLRREADGNRLLMEECAKLESDREYNAQLCRELERDAERFKTLEAAHALRPRGSAWCHSYDNLDDIGTLWGPSDDTLAELADRLRNEGTTT